MIREYKEQTGREQNKGPEKIDILGFMLDFYRGVKKLWWLVAGLAVIFAVKAYFTVTTTYEANYVASATVSVTSAGGYSYDHIASAREMAQVFPYILTSGVLKDVVAEDMGLDAMPGTIEVEADNETNLITLSVSADDPQLAYNTLMSVLNHYPEVAEFVLGETKLTILDETGIPEDNKRAEVFRGSYKSGALKGACIGLVVMMIYALSRRTVKSKKELKKQLNLTDCGSIPYVRQKKRRKKTFHNSVSLLNDRIVPEYLEAIRKIRIKIMGKMEEEGYKSLLVTSSIPGEGKTTLAANLAIAIARQGKKVILIDCDLRHPSVAGVMNEQEKHPGLKEVLHGNAKPEEALTAVKVPNGELYVLYGGEPEIRDLTFLGSRRMGELLTAWKKKADIVILDTAPSELLSDAPVMARYVDAALYVIRYDYTKMRQIYEGVQSLSMSGIRILGYVFNEEHSGSRHGYGYGYGYKRYGGYGKGYSRYVGGYGHYSTGYEKLHETEKGTEDKYGRVMKD